MPAESPSRDRHGAFSIDRARTLFRASFGCDPRHAASAPGRVNLIGEHTDYNDGFVLPMAIEQRTAVTLGPSADGRWQFVSEQQPTITSSDATADAACRDWTSYIRGVIAGFIAAGHALEPMAVAVASDVPVGGGLSSSAALEVAAATAFEGVLGIHLGPWEKSLLCQRAEHEFAGVPCGIMDQAVSVLGEPDHALLLDCRTHDTRPVRVDSGRVGVLVMNSMVRHELAGGAYARRRASCEQAVQTLRKNGHDEVRSLRDTTTAMLDALSPSIEPILLKRARHVVTENDRTLAAVAAFEASDFAAVGAAMAASHESLRDDYEVSCPELDLLVTLASRQPGVYGARMTGGGFGGCIVALVEATRADTAGSAIAAAYQAESGLTPDWFVTRPSAGAAPEPMR